MAQAARDNNQVTALLATSNADGITPVPVYVDPATHRLLVDSNAEGGGSSGTQYTEGDTDASITGTAIMWEDASDTLRPVSEAHPLPVSASIDPAGLATSAKQDTLIGHLDGVETLLTDIEAAVDGLEGKDYATSAKQDIVIGHLDGVEGLLTTMDADTGNIATSVDQIEGYIDQIEGYVDGIETSVDGIEGLLTTMDADTSNLNDAIKVDDAAFTPATTKVVMAGFQADETSTDSIDEGDAGAARITLDRKQIVTVQPHTAGGLSTYHAVSAASTNAANIKASAGQVYGWYIYNSNAAARKVVFHNTSGTPTAGASVLFSLVIPPSSGANVFTDSGISFSSGIGISMVTGLADSDATAVAANDLIVNVFYK